MTTIRSGRTRQKRFSITGPVRSRTTRPGVALVWVAIMGVLLISLVGLAMDTAVVYLAGSQLQIAADAAAIAGARVVRDIDPGVPRNAARYLALENKALGTPVSLDLNSENVEAGDIVLGRFFRFSNTDYCGGERSCCASPPCFDRESDTPNAVRVRSRRLDGVGDGQIQLVFGKMMVSVIDGVDVSRSATAMISGGTGAGIITLDPNGECSLEVSGSVNLDLTSTPGYTGDTAIQVNSEDPCAFCVNGGENTEIHAPETNIVGSGGDCNGYDIDGSPTIDTYLNPDSPSMPDPLAYLAAPPLGPPLGKIDPPPGVPTYYPPGYYNLGMKISGTQKVLLGPGIYIFDGSGNQGGFQTSGGSSVIANNVMIYMKSGKLNLAGTGTTTLTPMTEEINTNADYIGIAVFQARDNYEVAKIIGTADMDLQGTYYFPNNRLEVGGTGISLGNQLIAWQLDLFGNGLFEIQYDGRFQSPGSRVFLVQ